MADLLLIKNIEASTFKESSVIDYMLASLDLFKCVNIFLIREVDPLYSDGHNILHLELKGLNSKYHSENKATNARKHPKWQDDKINLFINNIDLNSVSKLVHDLNFNSTTNRANVNNEIMNEITQQISMLSGESAKRSFTTPTRKGKPSTNYRPNNRPWYGPQSKIKRNAYNKARKI